MEQRNKEIKKFRKKGWSYTKIGRRYNISAERVRQILHGTSSKPERKVILVQLKKEYKKRFNSEMTQKHLLEDIESLSKPSRKEEEVIKRKALIRYLYDELNLSFLKIGVLLHRDHTTIIHSYHGEKGLD